MATQKKDISNGRSMNVPSLNVDIVKVTSTPVRRDEGEYAFHDTLNIKCGVSEDALIELLSCMGLDNPAFVQGLPPEVTEIPLPGCHFFEHKVKLWAGTRKLFEYHPAELCNFCIAPSGNDAYTLTFQTKGIPDAKQHANLESVYLDAKAGSAHRLEIVMPDQTNLDLNSAEESEDVQQQ